MRRRNFILALSVLVIAAVVPAQKELWQAGSRSFHFVAAWCQRRAKLNERQKRMDAASKDLMAIAQAELAHIQKWGKFAKLEELVSNSDLGPEMTGRHGYVYSIGLKGNAITTSAYPAPGEQLPAVVNTISGPGLAPVLARLQKEQHAQ
jgi:hypothetical protein